MHNTFTKAVHAKISTEDHARLTARAEKEQRSAASVVRQAIATFLLREKQ